MQWMVAYEFCGTSITSDDSWVAKYELLQFFWSTLNYSLSGILIFYLKKGVILVNNIFKLEFIIMTNLIFKSLIVIQLFHWHSES